MMKMLQPAALRFIALTAGLWLAAAALPAPDAAAAPVGHSVKSDVLKRTYRLSVELPRGYDAPENAERRYPVVYILDGPNFFDAAAGIIRFPTGTRLLEPVILVGISHAIGENGLKSRVRDFTPTIDMNLAQYEMAGATAFRDYLEAEVIPLIDREYRTDPARRTLFGHSLGGSFGAWVMLTKPRLFSGYILASPSLWFDSRQIFRQLADAPPASGALKARLFMATGAFETAPRQGAPDMVADQAAFAAALAAGDYPGLAIETRVIPGVHHELSAAVAFAEGMNWLHLNPARGGKQKGGK